MEPKEDKKEIIEDEIKAPEITNGDIAPEGYTQSEWDRLSSGDKEGILDLLKNPDLNEDEDEIVVEGEIKSEVKVDEEVKPEVVIEPVIEPIIEVKKEEVEVSDMDLVSFRPSVTSKDLESWLANQPEDVKNKYIVNVPSDMVNAHNSALSELRTKFDADEISRDEYEDQRDEIKEKLAEYKIVERERLRDALKDEVTWDREQAAFMGARKEYVGEVQTDGTIKKTSRSTLLLGALQAAIKEVEATTPGLPGIQLLVKADKIVKDAFGLNKKVEEIKKVEEKKEEKKTPAEILKEKGISKLPDEANLGDVPEAGKNLTEDGWGAIDRLPDKKREEWLAKQPQKVVDAYVNSLASGR